MKRWLITYRRRADADTWEEEEEEFQAPDVGAAIDLALYERGDEWEIVSVEAWDERKRRLAERTN